MSDIRPSQEYVAEHREDLSYILKFSGDPYLRAVAAVLLIKEGDPPDIEQVKRELDVCQEMLG